MKRRYFDMSARQLILTLLLAATVAGDAFLAGCSPDQPNAAPVPAAKTLYVCGMHPQLILDRPGNCSVCGMKLTPVSSRTGAESASAERGHRSAGGKVTPEQKPAADAESPTLAIDSTTIQRLGIRTALVTRGPLRRIVRTFGVIDYDETTLRDVSCKFKGWIEKLYVKALGQVVTQGDALFDMASPDLYAAQAEYLLATGSGATASVATAADRTRARTKLKSFDVSDEQMTELEKRGEPEKAMGILAPQDGFVIEKHAIEGQMVEAGMTIYRLADLRLVWVQAEIYEPDLVYLQRGQEATMTISYLPGREFRGRVTYLPPNVDPKTHTARIRVEFHNPGYLLKPGVSATVKLASELEPSALLIPDQAILRSGEKTTVFVALAGGRFDPRTVALGPRAEQDQYQVFSGVSEGERIVISGQFLLDSESQLDEAIQKMVGSRRLPEAAQREIAGAAPSPGVKDASRPAAPEAGTYICPAPAHVSISYDQAGQCPLCGTTLVAVSRTILKKVQPGGDIIYYACLRPEHNEVRLESGGACPKCGGTLIPVMEAPPLPEGDRGMNSPEQHH